MAKQNLGSGRGSQNVNPPSPVTHEPRLHEADVSTREPEATDNLCMVNSLKSLETTMNDVVALHRELFNRFDRLEKALTLSVEKECYTVEEAAERLNRRPWTVRQWCNKGKVKGAYKVHGKGRTGEWRIPREALVRLQGNGPLPDETSKAA